MRPVDKGTAPKNYNQYKEARNDLGKQIGWYCSYCEMPITNMIEVEHIVPRNNGGDPLSWDNLLLSCKYCNTIKGARNPSRNGYIWPDKDNSDLAFDYSETAGIGVLNANIQIEALNTIELMGLDRNPGFPNEPTDADSRWIFRLQAWLIAKKSLENWNCKSTPEMANQIALTAKGSGFYSIWIKIFSGEPEVITAIRDSFDGTYYSLDINGNRIIRQNAII
ncbi:HNH endonuclease [Tenacibaculum ovolyticum]|uniref:HNH endonuclease n=1 Tax=Tenacibaculum ovolyticum TaxID=104270 RepID=UPI000411B4CB|nr:HNH endonuclease signature motif containing protein [Tenacibaculum ovolyticum]